MSADQLSEVLNDDPSASKGETGNTQPLVQTPEEIAAAEQAKKDKKDEALKKKATTGSGAEDVPH